MLSLGRNPCCRHSKGPAHASRGMDRDKPEAAERSVPDILTAGSMERSETLQLQACGSFCNVPNGCYWLEEPLGMQPDMSCRTSSLLRSEGGGGRLLE